jgi:hypothetical protein
MRRAQFGQLLGLCGQKSDRLEGDSSECQVSRRLGEAKSKPATETNARNSASDSILRYILRKRESTFGMRGLRSGGGGAWLSPPLAVMRGNVGLPERARRGIVFLLKKRPKGLRRGHYGPENSAGKCWCWGSGVETGRHLAADSKHQLP